MLVIFLIVSARVLYGLSRWWTAAQSGACESSFITTFGVAESLAAGATVLGYSFTAPACGGESTRGTGARFV